jgi:putative salt-induced outer membrane protein YdiY
VRIKTWTVTSLAVIGAAVTTPALGDVIHMKNGDRITGNITKVWDDELFIEPDYGDEFPVDLEAVASIEGDQPFEIELQDHTEVVGRLTVDEQGQPLLETEQGRRPFPPLSIEELEEIEDYFDWEVSSDLSFSASRGNTDTTDLLWQAAGMTKFGDHRHQLTLSMERKEQDGDSTKEQDRAGYQYSWFFRDPWFLSAGAGYERDPIRDLTYRYTPAAGLGYQFFDDAYRRLEITLAGVAIIEKLAGENEEAFAPRWSLDYMRKILGGDMEFFHRHSALTYVSGRDNDVIETSTGVRWEIVDDVYLNMQVNYDWESEPSEGNKKEDTTYLIGLGVALD